MTESVENMELDKELLEALKKCGVSENIIQLIIETNKQVGLSKEELEKALWSGIVKSKKWGVVT